MLSYCLHSQPVTVLSVKHTLLQIKWCTMTTMNCVMFTLLLSKCETEQNYTVFPILGRHWTVQ